MLTSMGWWLQLQHPACLMKMEMPPPSAAGVELDQMDHPAIYTAFDRILSVFLESSDISQTSNRLKSILPGQICFQLMCFTHTACLSDRRTQHQMPVKHLVEPIWHIQ